MSGQDFRTWRARPDQIHDGDTVRLVFDTGFDNTTRKWLRLRGDFAPELRTTGAADALAFVQSWVSSHCREGVSWPLEVDTFRTSGGNDVVTLARYVAEVRDTRTGESLNAALAAMLAEHPSWSRGIGA